VHLDPIHQYFAVSLSTSSFFKRFIADVLDRPDVLEHPASATWPLIAAADQEWLLEQISCTIGTKPREYWLEQCRVADVPCAPASSYADIGDTTGSVGRHIAANGYIVSTDHRDLGLMKVVAPPTRFDGTPNVAGPASTPTSPGTISPPLPSWHAPYIGEHSQEVLSELGYSSEEVERLTATGGAVPPARGPWAPPTKPGSRL
jgi:crotonobetainyl-CoA:carnitine CoA-transferase CaiB-like acyl-CoA transferase